MKLKKQICIKAVMVASISKYLIFLFMALLAAMIPLASADNVEPTSITLTDTNGNGIIDINDINKITFWVTGLWNVTFYNPAVGTTHTMASGSTKGQITQSFMIDKSLYDSGDDPAKWDKKNIIIRTIIIHIWSHDKSNGYTEITQNVKFQWYQNISTWQQISTFVITRSGKPEIVPNPGDKLAPPLIIIPVNGGLVSQEITIREKASIAINRVTVDIHNDANKDYILDQGEKLDADLDLYWDHGSFEGQGVNTISQEPPKWKSQVDYIDPIDGKMIEYKIDLNLKNINGDGSKWYYFDIYTDTKAGGVAFAKPDYADLSITKDDGISRITAGDGKTYTYNIIVKNNGHSNASGVQVIDTWPVEFIWEKIIPSQGTCNTALDFICSLGTIPAYKTANIYVSYTVPDTPIGNYTNRVEVKSVSPDNNLINNLADDENIVEIIPAYNISVKAIPTSSNLAPGKSYTYNIIVNNTGNGNGDYSLSVTDSDIANFTGSTLGNTTMYIISGGSAMTTLNVSTKPDGTIGAIDNTTITVVSIQNPAYFDTIMVKTTLSSDNDGDGIPDIDDNCPAVINPDQADKDGDKIGNACDNCIYKPNPDQADKDGDGIGDECENVDEQLDIQARALKQLEKDSLIPVNIEFEDGKPRFMSFEIPVSQNVSDDPVYQSLDFFEKYRDIFLFNESRKQLFLKRIVTDENGVKHLFFGQRVNNVPVYGAELAIHINKNKITYINGNYIEEKPLFSPPDIDEQKAKEIALENMSTMAKDIKSTGVAKLMYYSDSIFYGGKPDIHLSWRMYFSGFRNSDGIYTSWLIFIDANNGEILMILDESETGDRPGEDFDIETAGNTESDTCWFWSTSDDEWFDEDGVTGGSPDADGWNAFNFTHQTYHFFYDNFGRRSWDNDEEEVEVMVHVGIGWQNARFFGGVCDDVQFGDGFVTSDIFAHEFTHAVDYHSTDLEDHDQPGALGESYSDVFGALVEGNWIIGESSLVGAFRDMSNPPRFGQPDHFSNYLFTSISNDKGGVHTNSGIPNKAAYLISEGGTHNGILVNGIGREKTGRLYYEVLTSTVTSTASFNEARADTIYKATEYVRDGLYGFTSRDICDVKNAFGSVGIGLPDRDCDGRDDGEDTDDDGDGRGDSVDNCPIIFNPHQEDEDRDGIGNACDPDIDNDRICNSGGPLSDGTPGTQPGGCIPGTRNVDNCPLVPNTDQLDIDFDGRGEVCDDDDGDRIMNPFDNCPIYNPYQENNDGDSLGDACDPDDDNDGIPDDGDGSGSDTDNQCVGGNTVGCDDNCRITVNSGQEDGDSDGVGDVCDLCIETFDPTNVDTDNDLIGDVCDLDIDNDGICNSGGPLDNTEPGVPAGGCDSGPNNVDNCRYVANPHQFDLDHNGFGLLCDRDEAFMLSGEPRHILDGGIIRFRDLQNPIFIPINPCLMDGCPDYLTENYHTEVRVVLPFDMPTRIIDQRGYVVAKSGIGPEKMLYLRPSADYFNRFQNGMEVPGGQQSSILQSLEQSNDTTYQGNQYFLMIFPSPEVVPGKEYSINISIAADADGDRIIDDLDKCPNSEGNAQYQGCPGISGDANGDGKVNILDAALVGLKWGSNDPVADLNDDGVVNILDASIIGLNWGKVA